MLISGMLIKGMLINSFGIGRVAFRSDFDFAPSHFLIDTHTFDSIASLSRHG